MLFRIGCVLLCCCGILSAEETREVEIAVLKLTVPAAWKQKQASNNLRLGEFVIPAAAGDAEPAELVLSGPFGGSVAQNVERWVAQFEPAGREAKLTEGTGRQGKYVFADLKGTYKKPIGPPIQMRTQAVEGYRMLAVMYQVEGNNGGNYFLKLTGPAATVETAEAAMRTMIGAAADKEKPYEK